MCTRILYYRNFKRITRTKIDRVYFDFSTVTRIYWHRSSVQYCTKRVRRVYNNMMSVDRDNMYVSVYNI